MKKILLLVLFISTFATLAGTLYGQENESTDGSTPDDGSVPSFEGTVPSDLAALQSKMKELRNDPEVMKTAAGLATDPDLQALANDPEVMNAAKSLDLKALMANQKFVNAVNDQAVKDVDPKINEQE